MSTNLIIRQLPTSLWPEKHCPEAAMQGTLSLPSSLSFLLSCYQSKALNFSSQDCPQMYCWSQSASCLFFLIIIIMEAYGRDKPRNMRASGSQKTNLSKYISGVGLKLFSNRFGVCNVHRFNEETQKITSLLSFLCQPCTFIWEISALCSQHVTPRLVAGSQ